jgi:two-component system sensor histidine kinase VicK
MMANITLQPLHLLMQAIVHVEPDHQGTAAPNLDNVKMGRELVTSLALQVYQFASQQNSKELMEHRHEVVQATSIVSHLPLPMFVFNKELQVINASDAALNYCGMESSQVFGKPIFDSLSLEFRNDFTLDSWIQDCQENRVTHTGYWERVRVRVNGTDDIRQCDMAAFYNRENPSGTEFIVTLFDRTAQYNQDDESMGFVALAVHELRTPLTVLRGYIEVFNDELGDQLNDEHRDFMYKMEASANQLTSFVHNILNVARVDANQLQLQLTEENWGEVLHKGAENMELRAKVRGKVIEYDIAKDLPLAAVDSVSAYEVINNLLDNAIKYSPDEESKRIVVRSILNKEGFIETTIQDFGVGIPSSVLPNLFEKFYRNHRTRAQIGGTGLGLYLCKCIVSAHGGRIWANSKEGEGSTFGFTILPYNKLSKEQKAGDTSITRQANGWIKNHSYYRR